MHDVIDLLCLERLLCHAVSMFLSITFFAALGQLHNRTASTYSSPVGISGIWMNLRHHESALFEALHVAFSNRLLSLLTMTEAD